MRSTLILPPLAALGLLWFAAAVAPAQQVTVGTPFQAVNDSFFERIGGNFGFNIGPTRGVGGPGMPFGRVDPNAAPGMVPGRNVMDFDGGRGVVVGLATPDAFTPDLRIPFRQNSFGLAVPQFGGYAPGAGMTSGFQLRGPRGNASLFWEASQGSRQSLVSQTPSVTLTNGYPGSISDTSQSPFVVGVVPIVGGAPIVGGFVPGFPIGTQPYYSVGPPMQPTYQGNPRVQAMMRQIAADYARSGGAPSDDLLAGLPGGGAPAPKTARGQTGERPAAVDPAAQRLAAAQSSSAGRAVPSVAEARRLRQLEQAAQNGEAAVLYERGQTAEDGGKPGVAKIYYNRALKLASGDLRKQIFVRLEALKTANTPK